MGRGMSGLNTHFARFSPLWPTLPSFRFAFHRLACLLACLLVSPQMLEKIEDDGFGSIISWQPHGRCFVVHKPAEFKDLLPNYFKLSKIASFQRQLNLYGFKRLTKGDDRNGYYHELFLRGMPYLIEKMHRVKVKGTGVRPRANPDEEPDFWNMKPWIGGSKSTSASRGGGADDGKGTTGQQKPGGDAASSSSGKPRHDYPEPCPPLPPPPRHGSSSVVSNEEDMDRSLQRGQSLGFQGTTDLWGSCDDARLLEDFEPIPVAISSPSPPPTQLVRQVNLPPLPPPLQELPTQPEAQNTMMMETEGQQDNGVDQEDDDEDMYKPIPITCLPKPLNREGRSGSGSGEDVLLTGWGKPFHFLRYKLTDACRTASAQHSGKRDFSACDAAAATIPGPATAPDADLLESSPGVEDNKRMGALEEELDQLLETGGLDCFFRC